MKGKTMRERILARRIAMEEYQAQIEEALRTQGLPMEIADTVRAINANWQPYDRKTRIDDGIAVYTLAQQEQMLLYLDTLLAPYGMKIEPDLGEDGRQQGIHIIGF